MVTYFFPGKTKQRTWLTNNGRHFKTLKRDFEKWKMSTLNWENIANFRGSTSRRLSSSLLRWFSRRTSVPQNRMWSFPYIIPKPTL